MSESRLIVGLGNPGKDYEYTRHNLGFLVVRRFAEKNNLRFQQSSLTKGFTARGEVARKQLCCLLPLTFMNRSGTAVKQVIDKTSLDDKDVLIVCDDLSLDFGQVRIRARGSDGGHNGLSSVIESLETQNIARLRMGIGAPAKGNDPADYVLGNFKGDEKKKLEHFIEEAVDCCLVWLKEGISKAMDQFNKRKENGKS